MENSFCTGTGLESTESEHRVADQVKREADDADSWKIKRFKSADQSTEDDDCTGTGLESTESEQRVTDQVKQEADNEDSCKVKRFKSEEQSEGKTSESLQEGENTNDIESLSKKQRKRLEKTRKWLEGKKERRARERERVKRNKMIARMNNVSLGPSRSILKKATMANSKCKIRVVIDLSFDDLMSHLDIGKCVKQLLHCYSLNRRAENPMQLYFTNFNEKIEKEMEKHEGYRNWDIYFHSDSYTEVFNKSELLYLTSESDNVITELEDDKVYIIGGLVDHNAHKGMCYRVAIDQKIGHAKLPLAEFLDMKTRKVLSIDHVFHILLCVSEGLNWKNAFLKVLPARKGAQERCAVVDFASTSTNKASMSGNNVEPEKGDIDSCSVEGVASTSPHVK